MRIKSIPTLCKLTTCVIELSSFSHIYVCMHAYFYLIYWPHNTQNNVHKKFFSSFFLGGEIKSFLESFFLVSVDIFSSQLHVCQAISFRQLSSRSLFYLMAPTYLWTLTQSYILLHYWTCQKDRIQGKDIFALSSL